MIHNIKSCIVLFILVFIKDSIVCLPFGGTWKQVGNDIDGKAPNDRSVYSVAMSADGTTIVIGARYNNNINGVFAGQVRVYSINNSTSGNWTQIGSDINGKITDDLFGWSVCISEDGKTIAAGAIGNDENGNNSGQVRVYSYNPISTMWIQVGSDINGEAGDDQSGFSVDISADGKTVAIGGPDNSNPNGLKTGHVRVYAINTASGNWTQVGMDIDGKTDSVNSGYSVAMSFDGTTIAIGAPYSSGNTGNVRVFSKNSTSRNWTQVGSDIIGKAEGVSAGWSVATSSDGKTIAIGAPNNNNMDSNVAGSVRVYTINGTLGNWTQVGLDINGEAYGDQSGYSVALSADGKTIAIGAPFNTNADRTYSGHVRVLSINSTSGNWTQVGSDINGEASNDQSGYSVAISNDGLTVAIGAPFNDNSNNLNNGHVRVYKYELPPTKAPSRMPTKSPTKAPSKFPTRRPTKAPSKTPTKFPTRPPTKTPTKRPTVVPTKNPTKNASKLPTKAPSKSPSKFPTRRPTKDPTKSPTNVLTKRPTKNPTKAPSQVILPVPIQITVPIQVPLTSPVTVPTNCGLFNLNFFCPRRGECGFWRRLLNLHGC